MQWSGREGGQWCAAGRKRRSGGHLEDRGAGLLHERTGYNPAPQTCGNGKIDAGEQCDDAQLNGTSGDACDGRCRFKCGNGLKDFGEDCDNGVNDGSYGTCKHDCTSADYCGDGSKNGTEQCDLGMGNSGTAYGPGKCSNACKVAPYCGDHRVNGSEACDGQLGCTSSCVYEIVH